MPSPRPFKNPAAHGPRLLRQHAIVRAKARAGSQAESVFTLSIDIGGTGIKMIVLDAAGEPVNERARLLTPQPASPAPVLEVIRQMLASQPHFDRVSVGFPGVVVQGIVQTAPNLDNEGWKNFDLGAALTRLTSVPVRVINDADLQGYGVIEGKGVELVLTLGTGLGAALFVNGHLVPNLELGHHPFKKGKTYEDYVGERGLKRLGRKKWTEAVHDVVARLKHGLQCDYVVLGGGQTKRLKKLPPGVRLGDNSHAILGGIRLWQDKEHAARTPPPRRCVECVRTIAVVRHDPRAPAKGVAHGVDLPGDLRAYLRLVSLGGGGAISLSESQHRLGRRCLHFAELSRLPEPNQDLAKLALPAPQAVNGKGVEQLDGQRTAGLGGLQARGFHHLGSGGVPRRRRAQR